MGLRRLFLLSALAAVAVAVAAQPAASSYPGANGRIVFSNGTNDLWSVRPDGTGLQRLTTVASSPELRSLASFPSFSADGSKLAVMLSEFNRPTPCDPKALNADSGVCRLIVLMNADGSNQHLVYASEDIATLDLALSPNGSQIAFTMVTGNAREQLFVIDAGGKPLRLLTRQNKSNPATDTAPSWSPDGKTIAFQSTRDQVLTGHTWSLFAVNVRTGAISRIAPDSTNNDLEPNWSPDGTKLVFVRTFAYPDYRIYRVNRDGTGEREILRDQSASELPVWSPDGTQILYLRRGELWLAGADGSNPHVLASGGSYGFSWEPLPGGSPAAVS
jgi:Tol biopolymer transport system component